MTSPDNMTSPRPLVARPDPAAVQTAINREATDLTDDDIETLISHFRHERQEFLRAEASGKGARGRKATLTPGKIQTPEDFDKFLDGI